MPSYDGEGFDPPAPVARVTLRTSETSVSGVPMLLDTGADVTLIPQYAVERLGLGTASADEFRLIGFDGSTSAASVVQLEMLFQNRSFRGQFLIIEAEKGVIGRNVLNSLPILYDGPSLTWSLQLKRP